MIYIAPMMYMNYGIILPALVPAKATYGALKKLAIDQTVFASAMTAGFFVIINLVEGNTIQKGLEDLRLKYWTTMVINWQIWIPAQMINFNFTPIKFQVLFGNVVAIGYNVALSWIHHSYKGSENKDDESKNK